MGLELNTIELFELTKQLSDDLETLNFLNNDKYEIVKLNYEFKEKEPDKFTKNTIYYFHAKHLPEMIQLHKELLEKEIEILKAKIKEM